MISLSSPHPFIKCSTSLYATIYWISMKNCLRQFLNPFMTEYWIEKTFVYVSRLKKL